jgi:hypothetical protein
LDQVGVHQYRLLLKKEVPTMSRVKFICVWTLSLLLASAMVPIMAQPAVARELDLSLPHPMGCNLGEVYADMQDWWSNPDPAKDHGHLHIAVCFPHAQTVTGQITFDVHTTLHHNPGKLNKISIGITAPTIPNAPTCGGNKALACVPGLRDHPRTCPIDQTCTWTDQLTVDTALIAYDGWQEFRFKAYVDEPDGTQMIVSNGLHAYLQNGHPVDSEQSYDYIVARGWYTGADYTNATLLKPPVAPISGFWTPSVKLDVGTPGIPVTGHYIALDTDFHGTPPNPGIVIKEGTGPYRGMVTIDTRTLNNGWHRLFLKADALDSATGSTNSGALAIWFEVLN